MDETEEEVSFTRAAKLTGMSRETLDKLIKAKQIDYAIRYTPHARRLTIPMSEVRRLQPKLIRREDSELSDVSK